ncbi:endonuclease domain-containing protein [Ralstonia solanacearum]|uniref:endonuclease domain-containing protein n=1 Tax=Ralstonia solanacearum TaxID=305 RepID=UPI0005ABE7BB|nr:endonuclease domain-containing protein [Ralstonia solanacearum]
MTLRKLKARELPEYRAAKLAEQGGRDPITGWFITADKAAADHCHVTGFHRAVLGSWTNSRLGKIENAARAMGTGLPIPEVLRRCAAYIEHFDQHPSFLIHHTHKTPEERKEATRLRRNAKARERRAAAKQGTD